MVGLDEKEWEVSVQCEHDQMVKNEVRNVVNEQNIPKGADIIDSMWAMKKKANGDYRACLAAHGLNKPRGNHSYTMIFCLPWYMIFQCK